MQHDRNQESRPVGDRPSRKVHLAVPEKRAATLPGNCLLESYASLETQPIEDLRKMHSVVAGYYTIIKDLVVVMPLGNPGLGCRPPRTKRFEGRASFHLIATALNSESELIDRWGTALFIHPVASRSLTIRSAGPDRVMFNSDDLVLLPSGVPGSPEGDDETLRTHSRN